MSEKVYGICGTNKCRKEVIAKENIAVIKGIIGPVSGSMAAGILNFPEGFTTDNAIILSIMLENDTHGVFFPRAVYGDKFEMNIFTNRVQIKQPSEGTDITTARMALLKITE